MCFLAAINGSKSQASENPSISSGQGVGLAIGGLSLGGISYRQFFRSCLGFQATIGGFPASDYFDTFAGIFLTYKVYEKPSLGRLYILLGTGAILESRLDLSVAPGAGIGFEFFLRENLVLDVNLSIAPIIHVNHAQHLLGYIPIPLPGLALMYYL
jgi:hypothetical protein